MLTRVMQILCFSAMMAACTPQTSTEQPAAVSAATELKLNQHWQFFKSQAANADLNQASWQNVTLPHTPQIEPLLVNNQWQGFAWYKRELAIEQGWQGKTLLLRFEGAMNHAEVYLDNQKIGDHLGGYLPFTLDLTDKVKAGQSYQLLVKLDNRDNAITGPKPLNLLDFNTYGGLYRDVRLLVKNPVHITDDMLANQVAGGGIFVRYPKISADQAEVSVQTELANSGSTAAVVTVQQQLFFKDQLVSNSTQEQTLAPDSKQQLTQLLQVKQPALWSPDAPNLYRLETSVWQQGQLLEQQTQKIGLRQFSFTADHQLQINGKPTFLRGVNRHQEYPHVGYATSANADYRDAVLIKSAGFDYVRLSHYPHSKAFMQAADELGLVLMNAILGWQYYNPDPAFSAQTIQSCRDLIRRDRNHASVLAWECSLNESDMPADFIATLHQTVKQEYPGAYSAGWQHGYDMYLQARQHRQMHYETPTQPYNVSEYGDWEYYAQNAGLAQDSWADLKEEERTSRQLLSHGEKRLLQQARNVQEAHNDNLSTPAYADGYWVMFDYNRGYANDLEASGLMSIYRLPKYSYFFYQSQRSPAIQSSAYQAGPMVYIASDWTASSALDLRVFSNAEEVELLVNGQLVARQKPSQDKYSSHLQHPPFEFKLPAFAAGTLTARAYIGGKQVAEHQVSTPGQASAIRLELDTQGIAPVPHDVIFVRAYLKDAKGSTVPMQGQHVQFTSSGDVQILNPDVTVTEQGIATVLVRLGEHFQGASIQAGVTELSIPAQQITFE
ncbi:glycoside hydrolase family 2 TIM barrel-domain containing protein [Rheinheimera marina]|uniref:Glycoside hydrolase family 2 TIM barrel-domain containing protein n=1 Tax=Rheinheimera marina TaxID=1774958 RepID=A0ABV9JM68_9GAMM